MNNAHIQCIHLHATRKFLVYVLFFLFQTVTRSDFMDILFVLCI